LACAPITLLLPTAQRWQQLLREGAIGGATFARAQLLAPPIWDDFPPDHVWYYAAGSGPLLDVGVYALTALTGLFGPALRVGAMAATIMSEHVIDDGPAAGRRFRAEVADSVHLHLDFGHFFATFDVSWCVQASRNDTFEVYGEHGTLSGDPTYANTPIPSAAHARHVLDIMLTALRSAQEGRALALQTTFQLPMTAP